jgi:hypothetical protein
MIFVWLVLAAGFSMSASAAALGHGLVGRCENIGLARVSFTLHAGNNPVSWIRRHVTFEGVDYGCFGALFSFDHHGLFPEFHKVIVSPPRSGISQGAGQPVAKTKGSNL